MRKVNVTKFEYDRANKFYQLVKKLFENKSIEISYISEPNHLFETSVINGKLNKTGNDFIGFFKGFVSFDFEGSNYYVAHNKHSIKFSLIKYEKVDDRNKRQIHFPVEFDDYDELMTKIDILKDKEPFTYMEENIEDRERKVEGLTNKSLLRNITIPIPFTFDIERKSGYRERDILKKIKKVKMVQFDENYLVLRYTSTEGKSFEFEAYRKEITN